MKRLLCIMLSTLLCLYSGFALAEKTIMSDANSTQIFDKAESSAQMADTLFIASENRIYQWDGENEAEFVSSLAVSGQLLSDGKQLFVFDTAQGILSLLSAGTEIQADPIESYELAQAPFQDGSGRLKSIQDLVMTESYLYVLIESDQSILKDLLVFEYRSGKWAVIEGVDVFAIDRYHNDSIIAAGYDMLSMDSTCELRQYNGLNSTPLILSELSEIYPDSLVYQQETNTLFIETEHLIYAYDFQNQPTMVARDTMLFGQRASVIGGTYVFLNAYEELRALTLDMDGMEPITLTFAGARSVDTESNPAFSIKYPDAVIKYRKDSLTADYATELITNANAADIYCFPASSQTYRSIIEKGYAASLSANERILDAATQMYPQFAEVLKTEDGAIVAIPFGDVYTPILYAYNSKAWETAELNERPTTVDEFLDICQTFSSRDELFEDGWHFSRTTDVSGLKKEILQLIIQTYISEELSLSGNLSARAPRLIELLTKYEETIPAIESICSQSAPFPPNGYDEHDIRAKSLFTAPGIDLLPDETYSSDGTNMEFLLLTIQKDAEPIIDVDMTVFMINTSTPNLDLAIEYLQLYLESMSERERIQYFPSIDAPVLVDYYQDDRVFLLGEKADLESRLSKAEAEEQAELEMQLLLVENKISTLEESKWAIAQESIEKFKAATKHMKVYENVGINFFMNGSVELISLLNKYADGAIPKEQFVNRYDEIIRMVFSEQK